MLIFPEWRAYTLLFSVLAALESARAVHPISVPTRVTWKVSEVVPRVLLDTGPLVALLRTDDLFHEDCSALQHSLAPPLLTTWPVLTEAAWLLRSDPQAVQQMLLWLNAGAITAVPLGDEAAIWIAGFLRKYYKLKPQLADASLVYLAERDDLDTVFTLDRRDFSVYRFGRNRRFRILPD
jgi:predicted nucleic acid-binding protein